MSGTYSTDLIKSAKWLLNQDGWDGDGKKKEELRRFYNMVKDNPAIKRRTHGFSKMTQDGIITAVNMGLKFPYKKSTDQHIIDALSKVQVSNVSPKVIDNPPPKKIDPIIDNPPPKKSDNSQQKIILPPVDWTIFGFTKVDIKADMRETHAVLKSYLEEWVKTGNLYMKIIGLPVLNYMVYTKLKNVLIPGLEIAKGSTTKYYTFSGTYSDLLKKIVVVSGKDKVDVDISLYDGNVLKYATMAKNYASVPNQPRIKLSELDGGEKQDTDPLYDEFVRIYNDNFPFNPLPKDKEQLKTFFSQRYDKTVKLSLVILYQQCIIYKTHTILKLPDTLPELRKMYAEANEIAELYKELNVGKGHYFKDEQFPEIIKILRKMKKEEKIDIKKDDKKIDIKKEEKIISEPDEYAKQYTTYIKTLFGGPLTNISDEKKSEYMKTIITLNEEGEEIKFLADIQSDHDIIAETRKLSELLKRFQSIKSNKYYRAKRINYKKMNEVEEMLKLIEERNKTYPGLKPIYFIKLSQAKEELGLTKENNSRDIIFVIIGFVAVAIFIVANIILFLTPFMVMGFVFASSYYKKIQLHAIQNGDYTKSPSFLKILLLSIFPYWLPMYFAKYGFTTDPNIKF